MHIPHYKCLILRKTFPQLRELIDKSLNYYPRIVPGAKYNGTEHTWRFPSGAKIIFGSMNRPQDKIQYQGQAYDVVMFDELTHFTYDEYIYLFSRCRPNGPGTECYIRSTANPGNIGHAWVKERFINAGSPMETIWYDAEYTDPQGQHHNVRRSRVFVPSTVFDNQILMHNSPEYVAALASMPEAEKQALLYGDWNTFSGQVFCEWVDDPKHYDDHIHTHVINPFLVPQHWPVWCGIDWGYSRPYSVHWYAVGEDKTMYCIRELYGCTGEPNVGVKQEPAEVAQQIRQIEDEDVNIHGHTIFRVGDPAIWSSQGTESIGDIFERERITFMKGNNNRINGKMQVHHRLAFDENDKPKLQFFRTCKHIIRTLPNLVYDEKNVEDVDTDGEDHCYDEMKYVLMENTIPMPKKVVVPPKQYDPLDPLDDYYRQADYTDRYSFYQKY